MLSEIGVGARSILGEPAVDVGREVEAVGHELITTDVEDVVGEDAGKLLVDFLDRGVGGRVGDVELARVRLDGGVLGPVVVGPPRVVAGDNLRVDLAPTRGGVAGHVNLGNEANAAGAGVAEEISDVLVGVLLALRIGILGHLRESLELDGPGLGVVEMPVENVQLGEGQSVDLLAEFLDGEEITASVKHNAAPRVDGLVNDADGLLDNQAIVVLDDKLLPSCEACERAPDSLCHDFESVGALLDDERVRLINTLLQIRGVVRDLDNGLGHAAATRCPTLNWSRGVGCSREGLEGRNGTLDGSWGPPEVGDGLGRTSKGGLDNLLVGTRRAGEAQRELLRDSNRTTGAPNNLLRGWEWVDIDSSSRANEDCEADSGSE